MELFDVIREIGLINKFININYYIEDFFLLLIVNSILEV